MYLSRKICYTWDTYMYCTRIRTTLACIFQAFSYSYSYQRSIDRPTQWLVVIDFVHTYTKCWLVAFFCYFLVVLCVSVCLNVNEWSMWKGKSMLFGRIESEINQLQLYSYYYSRIWIRISRIWNYIVAALTKSVPETFM